MTLQEFEKHIKEKIPLARELHFQILSFENNSLVLKAPFATNKNDKNTVFAGSQASLALLAGWSLVTLSFESSGVNAVAAMKTEMNYLKPIKGDFGIKAQFSKDADLVACKNMLEKKGRAKILVDVSLCEAGEDLVKATFSGSYFLSV